MSQLAAYCAKYGSTVLPGVQGLDVQLNSDLNNEVTIGSPYPQFVVLRGQRPVVPMSSRAVSTILDVTGSVGASIDDSNNFQAIFSAMTDATGVIDGAGTNRIYTMTRGILRPTSLTCNHQEDALLNFEALLYSEDGDTAPVAIGSGALPTLPRDNIRHTLASATIGGVSFGCQIGLNISFGNNARTRGCKSNVWDTFVEQPGIQPVITLTGLNAAIFADANIPVQGKGATHANTVIWLRKRDTSGILFVGNGTAEHIKIDAEGLAVVTAHRGQGTSSAEIDLQITCSIDGSGNAPIGITTDIAIT